VAAVRFRCRVGFHKWLRIRETDRTVENPSESAQWRTVCRYCKRERNPSVLVSTVLFGGILVGSLVVFWFAPLLGAIIFIGAAGGLLVAVGPSSAERIARWLSR
jgi:hypothetical protein